jgi:polar amino acid transport system permease protein
MPIVLATISRALESPPGIWDWDVFRKFLFSRGVLEGVAITIMLSVTAQIVGSLIGLGLYFLRRSRFIVFRQFANIYIWIFRGTPLIVQVVLFWQLFPFLRIGNTLDQAFNFKAQFGLTNEYFVSGLLGALLALALNEGAYMAEIVRAGIDSIDVGQLEAAKSLGMTYSQGMRRIVIPQALRIIVPPLGNEFNSMLKSSSLASAASVLELYQVTLSYGRATGSWITFVLIAIVWYLTLTTIWGLIQSRIERRLNLSNIDPGQLSKIPWWRRMFGAGIRDTVAPETPEVALPVSDRR